MENFILYEELGSGSRSVVYKGRKKGHLDYVAIICAEKAKRPEITNHVRLSQDLDHPNIVRFYEWYETSNHLWLVVELCSGYSLESIVGEDGCLPEDVVRRFGWDLVKGLKYIHDLGIIFSELTPAKILLDGGGTLKFGNFCQSKTDEETLEDIEEKSPTYKAPEVLKGSETNMRSDLWALGCVLYYMFTGKPPFYSESYTEIREKILHQEPPPARQTVLSASPPSEDFLNLLQHLLNKNPNERMDWPELLGHSFWTQVLEEDKSLQGGR